jgi:hypothetical protein
MCSRAFNITKKVKRKKRKQISGRVLRYAVNMGREKPNFEDESLCLV